MNILEISNTRVGCSTGKYKIFAEDDFGLGYFIHAFEIKEDSELLYINKMVLEKCKKLGFIKAL